MSLLPHISEALVNTDDSATYEMRGWMECVNEELRDLRANMSLDFYTEVAKGNIPGHSVRGLVLRNATVGNTLEDIWGGTGDLSYPTAAESWEVVSSSANDSAAGTGAQLVLVNYLDDEYVNQSVVVALNGTTPVALNADHLRPDGAVVIRSGSSQHNEGIITVRVAGGGAERNIIDATFSSSQDCHFTVPAGKSAYALIVTPFYPKNEDGAITGKVIPFGTNTEITTGLFPFYQDTFAVVFKALFPLAEKTDVRFQARSANIGVEVNMVFEILLVDD